MLCIGFPNCFGPQTNLGVTEWDLRWRDDRTINQLAYCGFPVFTLPIENQADRAASLVRVKTTDDDGNAEVLNIPTRTYFKN